MSDVIFKTFRTYKYPYLYDRHTNSLTILTEDEFNELREVESGKLPWQQSKVVERYQEFGMLLPNVVEKIEHPSTQIIECYLKSRIVQLTLQVTQQCNLRCAYCAYSGIYEGNRTHSKKHMDWDTAKKAIDFFFERNSETQRAVVGFYGGEPLLEFDLIKKCVQYVNEKVEGKDILFNMTTNGTLLTDEVVDFIVENNFYLSISLDGSEEEHDANRKFANGKGSFETIIKNIQRIKELYPDFDSRINIMTTINPNSDLGCVLEYFSTDDIFNDKHIMFNPMKETMLNTEVTYEQKYYRIRNYEYIKALFALADKLDYKYVSKLTDGLHGHFNRKQEALKRFTSLSPIIHHSGPCNPGVQRLFVRYDGTLYPCERVNEDVDFFKIGTLDTGFDLDKVRAILNIGKVSENECKNCWGIRQCSLCSSEIEFTGDLTRTAKLKACAGKHKSALYELYELCVLNEFGFQSEGAKFF